MKRSKLNLDDISDLHTLYHAFWHAAQGKRDRPEVREFADNLDRELRTLARDIAEQRYQSGPYKRFIIHDPKKREISTPCFRDRVVHHALIHFIGPALERAAVFDSYACRKGKGNLKAVLRVQHFLRRFPWYVQIDIAHYFDSIQHSRLMHLLARKFKNDGVQQLCATVIGGYRKHPDIGLPIGALTSQYFANYYLDGLDRFLLETCKVGGMVRYMDDVIWWCGRKDDAKEMIQQVMHYLDSERALKVKPAIKLQRSRYGVRFCGCRILSNKILLSQRRKLRFKLALRNWEQRYQQGLIDALQLQRSFDAVQSMVAHTDSLAYRRKIASRAQSALMEV